MKKYSFFMLAVFMALFFFQAQSNPVNVIFVSEDKENFPEQIGNATEYSMERPGVAVEFLKKLEPMLNIRIKFIRMPWKKCLEDELKNGRADGAFLASYKKEREEFGAYPMKDGKPDTDKRVTTTNYMFCKLKGSAVTWDGQKISNLKGQIGAPLGYSIVGDIKTMGFDVLETSDTVTGLKQLSLGRLELFACLEAQAEYILKNNPDISSKVEIITKPITSKPYYLMLSKQFAAKNPDLANRIWDAVKTLRDKEYKALQNKYFK